MQPKIKFSVLLSLYMNESPLYLKECLKSLVEQTLLPNEIVIVFDGPISEKLESVVLNFNSKIPVKILRIENNVGLGKALNLGMDVCSYPYIARMDTDDICKPERFEKQIEFLSKNPNVSLLGSTITEFDGLKKRDKKLPLEHEEIIEFSKLKNPFNHMSVIFKKLAVKDAGGYLHHLYMEDYNLWLRMINNNCIVRNLEESLLLVRVGKEMLKRRRGVNYIKSELELFKLKKSLKVDKCYRLYFYLIVRTAMRMCPVFILNLIYNIDRKAN